MNLRLASVFVLLAVFAAGCTTTPPASPPTAPSSTGSSAGELTQASVSGGNGGTGGTVRDVTASVPSFSGNTTTVDNSGGVPLYFTGTISDANGEADLAFLFVKGTTFNATTGVQSLGVNHTINAADRALTSEPASYGADGYKVWDCVSRDGVMCWRYSLAVPQFAQSGIYTFNVTTGKNASVVQSASNLTQTSTVTSFSQIDFSPYPVDATGAVQTGLNWGLWTANPGDTNVASTNFIKMTNNGDVANARIQVSFSGMNFTGATDPTWSVPFASNVQFASCDTTAGVAPNACTFSAWTAANSGSTTVTFQGKGHVIFVQYRVVQVPATVASQSYGATFTATEL